MTAAFLGLLLLAVTACGGPKPKPAPSVPIPGIDLSGWKLSIPVENDKGTPTLLQPARVSAPWMVPAAGGGVEMWAPASGTTTENSSHPRTELNSLTNFKGGEEAHTLRATVSIQQVPQDGQGIIIGQIHGAADISSAPYVMLRYWGGREDIPGSGVVNVVVKQVQKGTERIYYPLLTDVPMNARFDYSITDRGDGTMLFTASWNGVTKQAVAPVPAAFKGANVRFQAGDYQQSDKPGGDTDGGRVTFHTLTQSPGVG
ncbi:MAG TPA: polysaccharide lyase family 7 protein [Pseudonocardia sp.]